MFWDNVWFAISIIWLLVLVASVLFVFLA